MASTLTTDPSAGDSVWVITTATDNCVSAIRSGVVIQVIATELTSGKTFTYDVRLTDDNGTTRIKAANIFDTFEAATGKYFDILVGVLTGSPPAMVV